MSVHNQENKSYRAVIFQGQHYKKLDWTKSVFVFRLAKSTLTLIPLLGIHKVVFTMMSEETNDSPIRNIWLFFELFFNSFQVQLRHVFTVHFVVYFLLLLKKSIIFMHLLCSVNLYRVYWWQPYTVL